MDVYEGSYFIKYPKAGQSALALLKQLLTFRSYNQTSLRVHTDRTLYNVMAADAAGLTQKGDAVLIPYYEGITLEQVDDAPVLLNAVKAISDWYSNQISAENMEEHDVIIHGDLHLGNIIFQEEYGRLVLIDALSKPAGPGPVWIDILTLLTSISMNPVLNTEDVSYLHKHIFEELKARNRSLYKPAHVFRAWVLLQIRFLTSEYEFIHKWRASAALLKTMLLSLKVA